MTRVVPLPAHGEVFLDAREGGRALRMSWHHEDGLVVLSVWRRHLCVATFQLDEDDVARLIASLASGLDQPRRSRDSAPPQAI